MKGKKKSERIPGDLYEEAVRLLEQSEILKETVVWQDEQVNKLLSKYTDEEYEKLGWEEKEMHHRECEEIAGRLEQSLQELKVLDLEYAILNEKIKNAIGRKVTPPVSGDVKGKIGLDDEIELL